MFIMKKDKKGKKDITHIVSAFLSPTGIKWLI